jgi:hypothetical protein
MGRKTEHLDGMTHAFDSLVGHGRRVIEDAANRGDGDSGEAGYIGDGRALDFASAHGRKLRSGKRFLKALSF